jgi:hypothetical protein
VATRAGAREPHRPTASLNRANHVASRGRATLSRVARHGEGRHAVSPSGRETTGETGGAVRLLCTVTRSPPHTNTALTDTPTDTDQHPTSTGTIQAPTTRVPTHRCSSRSTSTGRSRTRR